MRLNRDKFFELLGMGREDNSWDFKKEIQFSSKEKFNDFIKDVLAFSNTKNGGYILLGIEDESLNLIGISETIDEAILAGKIESILGYSIKFNLLFFKHSIGEREIDLGIMYFYESNKINVSAKTLTKSNGVAVRENAIYIRRNTRSIECSREDLEELVKRIGSKGDYAFKEQDLKILERNKDFYLMNREAYEHLKGQFKFTSNEFSHKINEIYYSQFTYNKLEFSRLIGFDESRIDDFFEGKAMPTLEHILRLTTIFNLKADYFFRPTLYNRYPVWQESIIASSIIQKIEEKDRFLEIDEASLFHTVFWRLSFTLRQFINWLSSNEKTFDNKVIVLYEEYYKEINNVIEKYSEDEIIELKSELNRNYYKVLERLGGKSVGQKELMEEDILDRIVQMDRRILCRMIIESINKINISESLKVEIRFNYLDDIQRGQVNTFSYDYETMELFER